MEIAGIDIAVLIEISQCAVGVVGDESGEGLRIDTVDFIWADVQGAEGDMIRGGLRVLSRTRYLYTEWSDDELYEGQATLTEILRLLPDFRVVELWSDDVLLENTRLASR